MPWKRRCGDAAGRGWHESHGDHAPDLTGVAVPLKLGERKLALVVAGPEFRMLHRLPEVAATIKRTLLRYAEALGPAGPAPPFAGLIRCPVSAGAG